MKKSILTIATIATAITLASCGQKANNQEAEESTEQSAPTTVTEDQVLQQMEDLVEKAQESGHTEIIDAIKKKLDDEKNDPNMTDAKMQKIKNIEQALQRQLEESEKAKEDEE